MVVHTAVRYMMVKVSLITGNTITPVSLERPLRIWANNYKDSITDWKYTKNNITHNEIMSILIYDIYDKYLIYR